MINEQSPQWEYAKLRLQHHDGSSNDYEYSLQHGNLLTMYKGSSLGVLVKVGLDRWQAWGVTNDDQTIWLKREIAA